MLRVQGGYLPERWCAQLETNQPMVSVLSEVLDTALIVHCDV